MAKKLKSYSEGELIEMFGLKRQTGNNKHPLMQEWTAVSTQLVDWEQHLFDEILDDLANKIVGWNEEMLKMNFIAFVLRLGHLVETELYKTYYESVIEATIEGHFLKVKADMMIAKGVLEMPRTPYFYFQEYKKVKDPQGDVMAQLLEATLIAQANNANGKPLYGCTVTGKYWEFMILAHKNYYISNSYDCTDPIALRQIIAILRKFKEILETRLID